MKRSTVITLTSVWSALRTILPESKYSLRLAFKEYKETYDRWCKHHGQKMAIKLLKEVHQQAKRLLSDVHEKGSFVPYSMWLATYSTGIPRCLRQLNRLLVSRHRSLRLIGMSMTAAYQVFHLQPSTSLAQILTPRSVPWPSTPTPSPDPGLRQRRPQYFKGINDSIEHFRSFLSWFVPNFFLKKFDQSREDRHTFTGMSAGPYGRPSFRNCVIDAITLEGEAFKHIWETCQDFLDLYGVKGLKPFVVNSFKKTFHTLHSAIDLNFSGLPEVSGPLRPATFTFLSEKGGKTRIVTAVNYWVQLTLFRFHHDMMNILSKIPEDFAFSQEACEDKFWELHDNGVSGACSYDMTGATDRFPRWVQVDILNLLIPGIGEVWEKLVTLPIYDRFSQKFYRFAVGQPMGIYSSWPVFSISHHAVVRYCAWLEGYNPYSFSLYMILGDDVVIFDKRVGKRYKWFLTKILGVEISNFKSIVSTKRSGLVCEFAKRNFTPKHEVSPITPLLLYTSRCEDSTTIKEILERVLLRWSIKVPSQSDYISVLFKRLLFRGRRNVTMTWFLSPKVLPSYVNIEGRIAELGQEIWHYSSEHWLRQSERATEEHQLDLIDVLKDKLDRLERRGFHIYGKSNFPGITPDILFPYYSGPGDFPLMATIRKIRAEIDQLSAGPDIIKDIPRMLVLVNWLKNSVSGKVSQKGNFYLQTRAQSARLTRNIAARAKEIAVAYTSKRGPLLHLPGTGWDPARKPVKIFKKS